MVLPSLNFRKGGLLTPALLLQLGLRSAQAVNPEPTATVKAPAGISFGPAPGKYSTASFNAGTYTTFLPNTDFSNEQLNFLWNQIGPVATGPYTSTVKPTPEPSSYPSPGGLHPLVPSYDTSLANAKLPDNFMWGVASSAYQVEGAVKDEGKGPSIWDLLAHRVPNEVADNSTGDIAAGHYYLYKQDIARVKNLGIPSFSPSISWPRIFPFGKGPVNAAGVAHYDDVIKTMVDAGITPVVTLFHWDTPLALFNEYGAWNDEQIVDDYYNYATFIISRYDKYVPIWFTINEPQYCNWQFSYYPAGKYYPAYDNVTTPLEARFRCGHYTLLAHAKVAKWYHEEFKGKGRITFKNSGNYYAPNTTAQADVVAAQRQSDFSLGWFGGPWTDGDYPQSLKDTLGDVLPKLTTAQKAMIKGSCDFYAIDGYTGYYATGLPDLEKCTSNSSYPGYPECSNSASTQPNGFPVGPAADAGVNWLYSTPIGIRDFLKELTTKLFPTIPDIMVTEFGFAEPFENMFPTTNQLLWDLRRSDYYQGFLDNILASRIVDKVNVTGAYGWAIFDNFEWLSGQSVKFGMQYLNTTSLERIPKASMFQFTNFFK
ncbi:hypothetical protein MMC25_006866 [Agyrium rufum]|nr:hypothetical protein [Agyrium rufum]